MQANKLKIEADHGRIDDDYAFDFINHIKARIDRNGTLTTKQEEYLQTLFDRY
jgi:hypothetical protein